MYEDLLELKQFIESLSKKRQIEVLRILTNNSVDVSENKNGSFINLTVLPENVVNELKKFVTYIKEQDISFEEIEDVKKDFKSSFFSSSKIDNLTNTNKDKIMNNINEVEYHNA